MTAVTGSARTTVAAWYDDAPRPGWTNMAFDHAMLDVAMTQHTTLVRLYRWDPACLSFGRHEPALRRYDVARIRSLGLDTVRRPTGGRAVWHARELTYAWAAPAQDGGGLRTEYHRIHQHLAAALQALGVAANLAPDHRITPGVGAGPCFAVATGGEVVVGGKKVIGSAQLRVEGGFLQHGSILLDDDQSLVRDLAGQSAAPAAETPLNRLVPRPIEVAALADTVLATVAPDHPAGSKLQSHVEDRATRYYHQYQSTDWTWSR